MTTQGIGDIKSTERGSGARLNAGKPHTFLIPLAAIASWMTLRRGRDPAAGEGALLRAL